MVARPGLGALRVATFAAASAAMWALLAAVAIAQARGEGRRCVIPGSSPFRLPALVFAGFLVVQAASAAALFALKLGGGAAGVRAFYLGDAARFAPPKSLAGLLEVAVPHLAAIPLVLFAVVHVVAFARALPTRAARALTAVAFGAALAGVASSFGVRYLGPAFAPVKVAAFALLEVTLLSWAALLAAVFLPTPADAPAREEIRARVDAAARAAEEIAK